MKFDVRKMSRRRSRPAPLPQGITTCCFCGFSDDDEVEFGKLCTHNGIVTHYYCLLLSSNMEQNGSDNEGILGFMPTDIQKELRRGKRLACTHCKRTGATLGCCNTRCKRVFHLPCGLRAGSLHQFFGEFRSYCITHRIKQDIDEHIKQEAAAAGTVTCYICYEEVNPQNTIRTLWAPCCRKNAWFHRKCVQRLALSAGYFFKCPLCNNKQEFQQAMLEHGIFIPNQDASWELVPNAYQELLHRHNRCDAVECLCPKGRSHTGVNAKWELVLCRLCGSQGVHKSCGHLKLASSIWECAECVRMLRKTDEANPRTNQLRDVTDDEASEDESSSDSDISVGRNPSPLPVTERPNSPLPIKLRPGPRSFKLQQAVRNAKSKESVTTSTSNTFVPENPDIPLSTRSDSTEKSISNEKSTGEAPQVKSSPATTSLLLTKITSAETNSNISRSEESNALLETVHAKSTDPRHRVAEVILIDSDDEVEIISVKPKQNKLTTKDGTEITIHSLLETSDKPQKAEGGVKILASMHCGISQLLPCQSKGIPATNVSIPSDASSLSNTCTPISDPTVKPILHTSNVPKSSVTGKNEQDVAIRKALGNRDGPDICLVSSEVLTENSVMNFKITNVTSVREEDFAATFQEPSVIRKINVANNRDGRSNLPLNFDPINDTPKPRTTGSWLSTSGIKDSTVKRKSEEFDDKNSCSLPKKKEVTGTQKRPRICETTSYGSLQKSTSIPWTINLNDVNGAIPMLATSISLTCSSNSNRIEQSTATLQLKPDESRSDINGRVRMIYNSDGQKKNDFYKYPTETALVTSVQNKTNNNMNHPNLSNNELSQIALQDNFAHLPKVTKIYSPVMPQTANRLSLGNMGAKNTNIHGTTHSSQQFSVNGSQSLTQQAAKSSESIAVTSHSVYQSHETVIKEIPRYKENGRMLQATLSTSDVVFYNGLPRNCAETPTTGSNGNQPNVRSVLQANHSKTQLANGISIPSGCDGDAGSSPAAEARFAHETTSRSPAYPPTKSAIINNTDATSDTGQSADDNSSISPCVSVNPSNDQYHSSQKTTRKYRDKPRMIPENVPLRDLKFRVFDPQIVQIIVHDTFTLNISADPVNLQKVENAAGTKSSIKKEKPLSSFTPQSNSLSSRFGVVGNYCDMNFYKEHDLSKTQHCSRIADNPMESTSVTGSLHNPIVPKIKFDNNDVLNTAAITTDSRTKAFSIWETRCNIAKKISKSYMNQASLAGNGSYYRIPKIDSITGISTKNESLIYACFEGNDRNLFAIHHKENVSKEEMVCPAFSNNGSNLKNLCERDNNIISVDKRKGFSENLKQILVKTVKYKNNVRSAFPIDFCNKTHNCSNDKGDKKPRSNGISRVSKCLVQSLDDSSESNLSIDCYNNFKIIDRSSEFNSNIKDLDANTEDSLRNNSKNVAELGVKNGSNKVPVEFRAKLHECFDTKHLNGSEVQTVNTNLISITSSAVLSSENINSDVCTRKPMNTALKDKISFRIDEKKSSVCESVIGIKVRIDLGKIQHFIDSNPQLFDKRSCMKSKRKHDRGSKTLPVLVASQNFHNTGFDNSLFFSKTQTCQSLQDTHKSPPKKIPKHDSEFFEDR